MDVLLIGLNMKVLNSLIWASAVIAKIGIVVAVLSGLFVLISLIGSWVTD